MKKLIFLATILLLDSSATFSMEEGLKERVRDDIIGKADDLKENAPTEFKQQLEEQASHIIRFNIFLSNNEPKLFYEASMPDEADEVDQTGFSDKQREEVSSLKKAIESVRALKEYEGTWTGVELWKERTARVAIKIIKNIYTGEISQEEQDLQGMNYDDYTGWDAVQNFSDDQKNTIREYLKHNYPDKKFTFNTDYYPVWLGQPKATEHFNEWLEEQKEQLEEVYNLSNLKNHLDRKITIDKHEPFPEEIKMYLSEDQKTEVEKLEQALIAVDSLIQEMRGAHLEWKTETTKVAINIISYIYSHKEIPADSIVEGFYSKPWVSRLGSYTGMDAVEEFNQKQKNILKDYIRDLDLTTAAKTFVPGAIQPNSWSLELYDKTILTPPKTGQIRLKE